MPLTIALDFDDTYTADREFWNEFIREASRFNHKVVMVTCRRDTPENREECRIDTLPKSSHYFTALAPKRWFMEQMGIKVDVWIDDMPESVTQGR